MKRISTAVLTCAITWCCSAQDAILQGKVTDAISGEGLIGVNVVYAPGKGAATDVNGAYALTIPAGEHRITFSFIGYTTRAVAVSLATGEKRTLDMKLAIAASQLDMVVVSAGRFEQRVGEVTQSMSVLQSDLIRNKNIVSMDQALDQVPGVVIVDEEPQIRAGSGFSYGAGSRVQVLVDDIPILSGDIGRPNWTFLPIENLEQVEVIKGASSVLYGSAALGGVINVRTAYPRSEPQTRVTTFAGIYDVPGHEPANWWGDNNPVFGGANFFHSRKLGQLDLVFGGNAFSDNGYVGPERISADSIAVDSFRLGPGGYEHRARFNANLRWRSKSIPGLNFGVNGNVMKSRSTSVFIWDDTDQGLFRPEPATVTRTLGTQYYIDPFINYYSAAGTRHSLRTRYHRQIFDNDNGQDNSNNTLHAEYQVQQKVDLFGETMLTGGMLVRNVSSRSELYNGNADANGVNDAMNLAGYGQVDKKLFKEKLFLSTGVRYEQFAVNNDVAAQPVFRAGATYRVLRATYVRASYGQGFRYPTIGERFISTSVGQLRIYPNPDLKPEQSWSIEGGLKQGFKIGGFMGYLDAVVFQQEYDQYVEFTFGQWGAFTPEDLFGLGFKSYNTGGARVNGYEFEMAGKGSIGKFEITALMGYTHTLPVSTTPDYVYAQPSPGPVQIKPPATYRNTSYDPTDNILKFRIQDLFRADVQVQYERLMVGMSVRYNSDVKNLDAIFVELDTLPPPLVLRTGAAEWMRTHTTGTTIVDARIGMDITEQFRVAFIVNNLTNEVYSLRPLSIEAPRSMQVQLSATL